MKKDFFSRYRFKKFGFIDLNKLIPFFREVNQFLNTHRIRKQYYVYFLFVIIIPMIFCIGFVHTNTNAVITTHHITLEVNSTFDPTEYIKKDYDQSKLTTIDTSKLDISHVGSYEVYYKKPILEYVLYVDVVDTNSPKLVTQDYQCEVGAKIDAVDFVEDYFDETSVVLSYTPERKLEGAGTYLITVTAQDEGNNVTQSDCVLTLVEDTKAPKVTDFGDLTYYVNQTIDYNDYFKVEDNYDPNPLLTIDDSNVDYKKVGNYTIDVEVRDRAGNKRNYTKEIKIKNYKGVVYLTFDDGPSQNTKRIIDILKENDIHATFFVTCNNKSYRKYIKEAYDNGNAIALHTGNHKYSKLYQSKDAFFKDLQNVSNMVESIIGKKVMNTRFPGGSSNSVSNKYSRGIMTDLIKEVKDKGYTYYDWNVDSGDADYPEKNATQIYHLSVNSGRKEIMILFHDSPSKTATVEALPNIIKNYQKRGYIFKSIEEGDFVCQHRTK